MNSHTLSRSSSHNYGQARDFDPILRNLSPTTTLRAFSEGDRRSSRDTLYDSLQFSTSSQRTLGTRAAQTCLDIRSWARELEDWEWPGTFETPGSTKRSEQSNATIKGSSAPLNNHVVDQDGNTTEYWGSLPAVAVQEYEQRTDEIIQQLDEINVEELKEFVLSAHAQAGISSASINDSIGDIGAATDLRRLDDFTAVITATILQALPYLSRLNRLLDTWSIRLAILRQAPSFLKALTQARADLDRGWVAISGAQSDDVESLFNRGTLIEMRSVIEHNVGSLGRKLDGFLDHLEGRLETVPESWIDGMETLESQYAVWIVQAERKILENDLKKNRWSRALPSPAAQGGAYRHSSDSARGMRLSEIGHGGGLMAPPILSPTRRAYSGGSAPTHASQLESEIPSNASFKTPATAPLRDPPRNDSHTIPSEQAGPIVDMGSTRSSTTSRVSSRAMRHVPIMLPYDGGDGQEYPSEGITGDLVSRAETPASETPVVSPSEAPTTSVAKKRALFSGDIERTQSLQRATKTPVRSFEHASNAFARLFKSEASSPERSRSGSLKSEFSHKRSGSGKTDHGIVWGGRAPGSPRRLLRKKSIDRSMHDGRQENGVPVPSDAPPVPVLPPKSPSKSLRSLKKQRQQQLMPSPSLPEPSNTEPPSGVDFARNWPLPSQESTAERGTSIDTQIARMQAQTQEGAEGTGLSSPKKPLESDFFHRMFIDSLPGTVDDRAESLDLQYSNSLDPSPAIADQNRALSPYPGIVVPTINPFVPETSPSLTRQVQRSPDTASASTPQSMDRPGHIDNNPGGPAINSFVDDTTSPTQQVQGSPGTAITSTPQSVHRSTNIDRPLASDLALPVNNTNGSTSPNSIASDSYSPEIQNARASYFQVASAPLSRANSVATTSPGHTTALSSHISPPAKPRNSTHDEEITEEDAVNSAKLANRASGISLESQPRLEVKSIDLLRRKSGSSVVDTDVQPKEESPSSPISLKDVSVFPTPPTVHEEPMRSPDPDTQHKEEAPSSPVSRKDVSVFPTPPTVHEEHLVSPLSQMTSSPDLHLLRHKTSNLSMVSDQASSVPDAAGINAFMGKRRGLGIQPNGSPSMARPKSRQETDSFDRHVSEVLEKLPSSIRFRSGATTPRPRTAESRTFSGPRPKNNPRVPSSAYTSPGGLTLAPADPSMSKKSSNASDPEVKLYHLTQAGREEPIKLFVRLVGEGERVMVRVGGGWADLADYLRQYADHHGSRTVSGEVDVKAMGSPAPGSGNVNLQNALRRKASGPLSAEAARVVRAHSPLPATPPIGNSRSEGSETSEAPPALTPSRSPMVSRSRPSTADSSKRPSSKHSWSEMSMAGPGSNGKKIPELPDEKKARWVEGMVEMVQKASAEKSKKGESAQGQKQKPFGELGKVGGTRRVVFRNASSGPAGPAGAGNGDSGRG